MLNDQIRQGEALLAAASIVGDSYEHRFWRMRRDRWASDTVQALVPADTSTAGSFERALRYPCGEGTVAEDLPVELEALRRGLAFLRALRQPA